MMKDSLPAPSRNGHVADVGAAWKADLPASLVVFMVALPLCIAIARACNAPAEAGIITGVVGGLVVGFLAGSPLQVSGPAAGLIVLVLDVVNTPGLGLPAVGVAAFLAGLLQLGAAYLKLGQWFRAVSPAVIHGMLAGIGLVIIAKQSHVLVDDVPGRSVIGDMLSIPHAVFKAFNDRDAEFPHHRSAAAIGILTIIILFAWKPLVPRRLRFIPAALVAVLVASALGAWIKNDIKTVEVESNLLAAVHWLHQSDRSLWLNPAVLKFAAVIAFIASAETLLCAAAVDRMHRGPRTKFNRELAAQGVGNVISGALGALPMTGVIVRSSANVEAGARSRLSSILHGAWLLLFVVLLPDLLKLVPLTALAAILIVTGYRLLDFPGVREMWRASHTEAAILVVTALTVVGADLLVGVLTGLALSVLKLAWTFSHLHIRVEPDPTHRRTIMWLEGAATFIRLPFLADALDALPPNTELHVDFTHLTYIDHACLELLVNWEKQHHAAGGRLTIDWDSLHARFRSPRQATQPTHIGASAAHSKEMPV